MYHSKNLEIHIVDHCNLDCVGCSHESPLMARRFENPDRIGRALSRLWEYYETPLLNLLGGEPLMHPSIGEIISIAKAVTQTRLRVVTNGTLLGRRYHNLLGIDEIHISAYPEAQIPGDEELLSIAKDLVASVTIQTFDYFRWHRSLPRNNPGLTEQVFTTCQLYHVWQCHTLRDGWFYPCSPAATWGSQNGDGVDLLTTDSTVEEKLQQLLTRKTPLASCNECLGSIGQRFPHHFGWRGSRESPAGSGLDLEFMRDLVLASDAHNECFEYIRTIHPSGHVEIYKR